ncbi:HAD family hydrolase [Brunnivagina elsteri]|uniref:Haloacid dehalogenase n=1 Tax=Brunnivagina elsteri CCALA 953 TaxID=987040 RepID=A0A2A2TD87_9CYAN|nr:HAD hydrolase-like protein [Calothrix elsteri]PAX51710.1 haloacid dehalogenase [Calothrix elsteri CCALA 953]
MTAIIPTILASDFDGVICDGMVEYFEVAWRTYCQIWTSTKQIPSDELASKFYSLRPVIETGWEMPVLIKALVEEIPEETILRDWVNITQTILSQHQIKSSEVSSSLDKLRDEWIENDLEDWMSLHRFYPGILDRIKNILASDVQLYIVTTKEGRFVHKLLQKEGLDIPREVIFGKEYKRPKYEILRELRQKADGSEVSMWFIEDRLNTLQLVQQQSDLDDVKLFLADWGYNTPSERVIAHNNQRIDLLSLGQFGQEFSKWAK